MSTSDIEYCIRNNPHYKPSRLVSLYSNFEKLESLNPEGFEANVRAWENLLSTLTKDGKLSKSRLTFSTYGPDLSESLSLPEYGKPQSIGTVIEELVNRKRLVPLSYFMEQHGVSNILMTPDRNGFLSNMFPLGIIRWGLAAFNFSSFSAKDSQGNLVKEKYIIWDQLEATSETYMRIIQEYLSKHKAFSEKLFDEVLLLRLLSDYTYVEEGDLYLILLYWSKHEKKKCNVQVKSDKVYISFDTGLDNDQEIPMIDIKSSLYNLEQRNNELESKINEIDSVLKEKLQRKVSKESLVHLFKLKQIFNTSLAKSLNAVAQLNDIMNSINDAALNKKLYDIIGSSSKLIKDMNSKMSMEDIISLKTELQDEMTKTEELHESLISGNADYDVDEEFNKLYNEAQISRKETADDRNNDGLENEDLLSKLEGLRITPSRSKQEVLTLEAEPTT